MCVQIAAQQPPGRAILKHSSVEVGFDCQKNVDELLNLEAVDLENPARGAQLSCRRRPKVRAALISLLARYSVMSPMRLRSRAFSEVNI